MRLLGILFFGSLVSASMAFATGEVPPGGRIPLDSNQCDYGSPQTFLRVQSMDMVVRIPRSKAQNLVNGLYDGLLGRPGGDDIQGREGWIRTFTAENGDRINQILAKMLNFVRSNEAQNRLRSMTDQEMYNALRPYFNMADGMYFDYLEMQAKCMIRDRANLFGLLLTRAFIYKM